MAPPPLPERVYDREELARVRSAVLVKLEEARNAKAIGGALEARVVLASGSPKLQTILKAYEGHLPALFIVSQVAVEGGPVIGATGGSGMPNLGIKIEKADGKKCERCWNYSVHVGENPRYPTICERCTEALDEIERSALVAAG